MSLAYRLGSVAFIMALMALALYILTAGILGRKIHWKSLGIFFICGEVFQWSAMFLWGERQPLYHDAKLIDLNIFRYSQDSTSRGRHR